MTKLDEAMQNRMASIVLSEHRPFCYFDFLQFEVEGFEHSMSHGTFRNKIFKLRKKGDVEVSYRSVQTFYTLKSHKFGKPMTPNHTGVSSSNNTLALLLQNLALGKNSIHNIRLRFKVDGLWSLAAENSSFVVKSFSKDIRIGAWQVGDLFIRVTVHRTNTVTVAVGCSYNPIVSDVSGIILLSEALTRVEERISALIGHTVLCSGQDRSTFKISDHKGWIVTMWHFGADSITEHSGRDFHMSWEVAENALIRTYTKDMKDRKRRIRIEKQEYPDKPLSQALEEKLSMNIEGRGYRILKPISHDMSNKKTPTSHPVFSSEKVLMDYTTVKGIHQRTGVDKPHLVPFVLKELLDNAVDFIEKYGHNSSNHIVKVKLTKGKILVANSNFGIEAFTGDMLKSIFSFDRFYSEKRNIYKISRGNLGDALKEILCVPYALALSEQIEDWNEPLVITGNKLSHAIHLTIDRVEQTVTANIQTQAKVASEEELTTIEFRFPFQEQDQKIGKDLVNVLIDYGILNPHISF